MKKRGRAGRLLFDKRREALYYSSMTRTLRSLSLLCILSTILALSCRTVPEPPVQGSPGPDTGTVGTTTPASDPAETPFDPAAVSAEVKQTTITDVRAFIDTLNLIIRNRDYEAWTGHLTGEYLERYSDPAVLAEISLDPALKRYGIVLRSLRDYFTYVVYPSRQNSKVDDIEFLDKTRIKVLWTDAKGERLVLYNLEKIGDTWKIAFWR